MEINSRQITRGLPGEEGRLFSGDDLLRHAAARPFSSIDFAPYVDAGRKAIALESGLWALWQKQGASGRWLRTKGVGVRGTRGTSGRNPGNGHWGVIRRKTGEKVGAPLAKRVRKDTAHNGPRSRVPGWPSRQTAVEIDFRVSRIFLLVPAELRGSRFRSGSSFGGRARADAPQGPGWREGEEGAEKKKDGPGRCGRE
ncbi:hypothetical protein KM043_004034 [Ampulex compressa]|nr:hypothetical protein KM043_004034 [Ampulex compressa]